MEMAMSRNNGRLFEESTFQDFPVQNWIPITYYPYFVSDTKHKYSMVSRKCVDHDY
jgi:hypothetical protein